MPNKILVTGSNGFVGQHLVKYLKDTENRDIHFYNLNDGHDIRNYEQIRNYIDYIRPTHIYHLAAQAYVPESFTNPRRTFEVNTIGSINVLEAIRELGLKTKILLAGTSEEYGDGEVEEDSELIPRSPYAVSKMAMDRMGLMYAKSYGMNVVITRAFNHTGPGRGEMYAESSFAKQIAEIEAGRRKSISHGDLHYQRNYTDVRDVVRAYTLAIELESDVYNICSDRTVSMQFVMNTLLSLSTKRKDIVLEKSTSLLRPNDFSFKEPNCNYFHDITKWKPEIELEQTLFDLLDYWRKCVL